jgi:inner membrane protein
MWAGVVLSILPDLDVLAFRFGIPYANQLGHRGFSHALLTAALVAALVACVLEKPVTRGYVGSFLFLFVAMASHGLLDTLTTGGQGIALLWPWSEHRFFAPWQVIRVSPLSIQGFMHGRGLAVLRSELVWIWLPALATLLTLMAVRINLSANRAGR